jgi:hypothetical protein
MPHLVEMQEKYRANGLVCMTVSGDDKDDAKKALAFLQRINAKIENYHWIESIDDMEKHLGPTAFPTVVVFGRDGKKAKVFSNEDPFEHGDVEKYVKGLLN